MSYCVSSDEIIRLFGLNGIVLFPREAQQSSAKLSRSMRILHEVGLPHGDLFLSRMDVKNPSQESVHLGEFLETTGRPYPAEAQKWLVLGYFNDSILALDPDTEHIYAFPEGTSQHLLIHRDTESLIYSLCALQAYHAERDESDDERALAQRTHAKIKQFDSTPFNDPISEWNIVFEEILEGSW
ncbi:SUKH-4 family immunity protein [Streptomyces atroolivaceus]|uniref:SUKH-4 family immunity protein n=1 Tax=Streptomyces atroolivaceus TaxID=66869 RepID=UPI0020242DC7|nr:SUKH-4 family immunity protein [Streptomyces atroolivaceus]